MPEETNSPKTTANGNKTIIIIVSVAFAAFLITIIIGGGIMMSYLKNLNPNAATAKNEKKVVHEKSKHEEVGGILSLGEELILNVNAEDRKVHYVKLKLSVEIIPEKAEEEAKKRIPEFRDLVINIVTAKTVEKIAQKEGKDSIRREIITQVNKIFTSGRVKNVFFEDFLVQ